VSYRNCSLLRNPATDNQGNEGQGIGQTRSLS
jgi:hypothetical protein